MVVDWMNYVHRPTKVRAFKWDGTPIPPDAFTPEQHAQFGLRVSGKYLCLHTNIGDTFVPVGWWIVLSELGEAWGIRPDVFEHMYMRASEAADALPGEHTHVEQNIGTAEPGSSITGIVIGSIG